MKGNLVGRASNELSLTTKSVKRKKKNHELSIMKAEKGNQVVIMIRKEYKEKMKEFFNFINQTEEQVSFSH